MTMIAYNSYIPYYAGIMRITGGIFCRHQIKVPKGGCRPTQDMVREALFSIIGPKVVGARFLDLFAGSGAIGLEALSRGAESVCWVESDRRILGTLKENVERIYGKEKSCTFGLKMRFSACDALKFLQKGLENQQFDLIFADPPYDKKGRKDWLFSLLNVLGKGNLLAPRGLFIMEQSADEVMKDDNIWVLIKDRVYGGTRLRFFVKKEIGVGNDKDSNLCRNI
ncbi:MAG: 16S rRNA (guanine(966)-N(2))-methyltransferase RsmD [Kiritimatiellae bacterium]|nr:16S rRNA (guanine(966)-N(2))-methyltransferase RsmD [Kiritimatiellia bacterium]MDD5520477.1 16S rRNA (guanine(966)-N(2))-methyltransferase RsmD [Kiritimatiellia bacterium]